MSRFDFTRKDYAIPARPRVRNPERMIKWVEDILDSYYEDRLTLEHDRAIQGQGKKLITNFLVK